MPMRWTMAAIACVLAAAGAAGQVVLRGQESPLEATVTRVDEQGVTVSQAGQTERTIAWDRVASVADPKAAAFAQLSDTLWRARTRLARGDAVLAEPAFEQLFQTYAVKRGATTSVIAEGLIRARLARGATGAAVAPWLVFLACGGEVSMSRDARQTPGGYLEMPGLPLDIETGLIPELPPIWMRGPASAAFAKSSLLGFGDKLASGTDQRAAALGALYQASAAFENELGASLPEIPAALKADKTVRLVALMVSARISDDPVRLGARRELEREIPLAAGKPWFEAWLRVSVARSLLRDQSRESKLQAIGQLAHLPARLAESSPYLTGVALAEMAVELNELGDSTGALALRDELLELAPDHPALETEPMRRWPRSKPRAAEGAP